MGVMTDEEKFCFDLQGYIVVNNVLSPEECTGLCELADRVWPQKPDDGLTRRTEDVSQWDKKVLDLMDHPKILPYLVELIGSRLRIDHDYCIFMKRGGERNALHGGPRLYETDHWYRYSDGIMRNGLMVATWALTDAEIGDGGFVCIPGSHKTNYLSKFPKDIQNFQRDAEYIIQPKLLAGDVLIFTEALIHGTRPWRADHERRTLLFKYSPPHSTWRTQPFELADYPNATDQQKRLMAPPSVQNHPPVIEPGT